MHDFLAGPDAPDRTAMEAVPARLVLRVATASVHERMHRHPGFLALAEGRISADAYRDLLARLYGFHRPFERLAGQAPHRSVRLAEDLRALGLDPAPLPLCAGLPPMRDAAARLGGAYVAEGAALGGRVMARAIASRPELSRASRFLTGDGSATGPAWAAFLLRLEAGLRTGAQRSAALAAATAVFAAFEGWMAQGTRDLA